MNYLASIYQKRFWLEWSVNPNSSKYNETLAFEINGKLNIPSLKNALNGLQKKHIFLKSSFFSEAGKLYFCSQENISCVIKQIKLNKKKKI